MKVFQIFSLILLLGDLAFAGASTVAPREECCFLKQTDASGYTTVAECWNSAAAAAAAAAKEGNVRISIELHLRGNCHTCAFEVSDCILETVYMVNMTGHLDSQRRRPLWHVNLPSRGDLVLLPNGKFTFERVSIDPPQEKLIKFGGSRSAAHVSLTDSDFTDVGGGKGVIAPSGHFAMIRGAFKGAMIIRMRGPGLTSHFREVNFGESVVQISGNPGVFATFINCDWHRGWASVIRANMCINSSLIINNSTIKYSTNTIYPLIRVGMCKREPFGKFVPTVTIKKTRIFPQEKSGSARTIVDIYPDKNGPIVTSIDNDFSDMSEGRIFQVRQQNVVLGNETPNRFVLRRNDTLFHRKRYNTGDYMAEFICSETDDAANITSSAFEIMSAADFKEYYPMDGEMEQVSCREMLATKRIRTYKFEKIQPLKKHSRAQASAQNFELNQRQFAPLIEKNGWNKFVESHRKFYAWLLKTALWHAPADDKRTLVVATTQSAELMEKLELYEKMGDAHGLKISRQLATNYMRLNTFKERISTDSNSSFSFHDSCGNAKETKSSSIVPNYGREVAGANFLVCEKRESNPSGNYFLDMVQVLLRNNQVYIKSNNSLNALLGVQPEYNNMMVLYYDEEVSHPTDKLTILFASTSQAPSTTWWLTTSAAVMLLVADALM